jgi:hypothetical protein
VTSFGEEDAHETERNKNWVELVSWDCLRAVFVDEPLYLVHIEVIFNERQEINSWTELETPSQRIEIVPIFAVFNCNPLLQNLPFAIRTPE